MAQPGEEREASCQRPPAGMLLPFPLSSSNPVLLSRLEFGRESPASNLPGGEETWSLLPAWVRGGLSIVRKQDFICGHVFPASQA